MKQILHIFWKDVRHFWPEISISLLVTAAYAALEPAEWQGPSQAGFLTGIGAVAGGNSQILVFLLACLVPVSWGLLVARVVHAERLVGDTQAWITRPYPWPSLLAAKLLFLLATIYLPIFLAQSLMLAQAGFNPLQSLPGLAYKFFLFTEILILPLAAIAAVTSSFARMTLTLLGVLVGVPLLAFLPLLILNLPSMPGPFDNWLSTAILILCCAAAIVLQYARRTTTRARLILAAVPVLFLVVAILDPDSVLMERAYPHPPNSAVQLTYDIKPNVRYSASVGAPTRVIGIAIPVRAQIAAPDTTLQFEGVKATIEGPNGFRATYPWLQLYVPHQLPGENEYLTQFQIPRAVYDRLRGQPLRIHLSYALTLVKAGRVTRLALPHGEFALPGFGICSPLRGFMAPFNESTGLNCRSALRQPLPLTYATVLWSNTPCEASNQRPESNVPGSGWGGNVDRDPAVFGVDPVVNSNFGISNSFQTQRVAQPRFLCTGTPITFTEFDPVSKLQADLTVENFQLPAL